MATCPKCKEEINYLHEFSKWEYCSKFFSETEVILLDKYITSNELGYDYECPKCGHLITNDTDFAENFLKGGK